MKSGARLYVLRPNECVSVGVDLWDASPGVIADHECQVGLGSGLVAVRLYRRAGRGKFSRKLGPVKAVVKEIVHSRFPFAFEVRGGSERSVGGGAQ